MRRKTFRSREHYATTSAISFRSNDGHRGHLKEGAAVNVMYFHPSGENAVGHEDRVLAVQNATTMVDRSWGAKTLVLQSSHLPMLSQPYEVADFIGEAASQLGLTE